MISYEQVLARFKAMARPDQLEGMARYGMSVKNRLGVAMPELRAMGKEIGKDHHLALRLWESGIQEARILAALVEDPQQVVVLETDRGGRIWLILAVTDLVHDGSLEEGSRRHLRNLRDGKYYLFVPEGERGGRPGLSPREIEVLGLVAVGLASREIADRLFISVATVNNHRQRILEKMQVRNSSEAVRYAGQLGIL